jgi:uncharacterized protein (DUF305 family)
MESHQEHQSNASKMHNGMKHNYSSLAFQLLIHFIIMYLVMYTMIAALEHFYLNLNNFYMTLMMVTPMALLMLVMMRSMYPSRLINLVIGAGAIVVFVASFAAMRSQAAVGNKQFLLSMIPHHSGAILMCEQASLSDPEIISLCSGIIAGQAEEIARMKQMLERY